MTLQDTLLELPIIKLCMGLSYLELTSQFLLAVWLWSALGIALADVLVLPDLLLGSEVAVYALLVAQAFISSAALLGIPGATLYLVAACTLTFFFEHASVTSCVPFGCYVYTRKLGPALLGVPLLIPFAWYMMAFPSFIAGLRLLEPVSTRSSLPSCLMGACLMTLWAVPMDPYMASHHYWVWLQQGSWFGTPLVNYAGWFAVSLLLMLVLWRLLRRSGWSAPLRLPPHLRVVSELTYAAMLLIFIPPSRSPSLVVSCILFLFVLLLSLVSLVSLVSLLNQEIKVKKE
ncbi:MAG: carotenoid biosynthesis protein [archaeon]|nr:carotenoid biosynthesis protein [archaeon]